MKLKKATLLTGLALLTSSQVLAHGYVESPASRAALCKTGENSNCGNIQYEPQSIEAPDGFFESGKLDNKMGSAGVSMAASLNEQNQSRWAKTVVTSGQFLNIKWNFTANHITNHFKFYITKVSWNPDQLLTRDSFEDLPLYCDSPQPFWQAPQQPSLEQGLTLTCRMPDREGYQVIMAEWDVGDTTNSFYNLLDVYFTNDEDAGTIILPGEASEDDPSQGVPNYDPARVYTGSSTEVVYDGKVYKNKWYAEKGEVPTQSSVWEYVREHQEDPHVNPNDRHPVEATKFNINPLNVKDGDVISLELFKAGGHSLDTIDLLEVKGNISPEDLKQALAIKINEVSAQQLNGSLLAGEKNSDGIIAPSKNDLYVYQTSDKPYSEVSFHQNIADHNLINELHLMSFDNAYTLDYAGNLNIKAKIMSHSSDMVNVSVTLQDKDGNKVYRESDIEIQPMQTHELIMQAENVAAGDYKLIISSSLSRAETWQKTLEIKVNKYADEPEEDISKYAEYVEFTEYKSGDIVRYNGELYRCKPNVAAWCSGPAWAYAPSSAQASVFAWELLK
jgi:chitin-binding protein